jgi:hypothetical protein
MSSIEYAKISIIVLALYTGLVGSVCDVMKIELIDDLTTSSSAHAHAYTKLLSLGLVTCV